MENINEETQNKTEKATNGEIKFVERKRWLFLGLPWTFTKYSISDELITIDRGFLNTTEDDCYMYKVVDVKLTTSLFERIVGVSTVSCFTGDTTDKEIKLLHIRNGKAIKNYILEVSEKARLKRRTLNTLSLNSVDEIDDIDN